MGTRNSTDGGQKENVIDFIRTLIIYQYGVPRYIITDNDKPFSNSLMTNLYEKFKFTLHKPSVYVQYPHKWHDKSL